VERPESLFKPNIVSRVVRGGRLRDVALPEPRRAVDETAGV
jgi:hypothetical protein